MRDPGEKTIWRLCVATSVLWASAVFAQSSEDASWSIALDNDSWGLGNDNHYTHGTRVTGRSDHTPDWLIALARPLACHACTKATGSEYEFGQEIYTPFHMSYPGVVPWDRPYAGWLYAKASLLAELPTANPRRKNFSAVGFQIGVVGPAAFAEQTQKLAHKAFGKDLPRGWDNELSNELGLVLSYRRGVRYDLSRDLDGAMTHRVSPYVLAAAGNVATHVGVGTELRTNVRTGHPDDNTGKGWQFFLSYEAKAIIRNIFLDGNTWSSSHSVEKEPLVTESSAGIQYQGKSIGIRLSRQFRSKEFVGQPWRDSYNTLVFWFGPGPRH